MLRRLLATLLLCLLPPVASAADCALPPSTETVTGARALDGNTFETTDGRVVRLPAIAAPATSQADLAARIAGKPLVLHPLSRPSDRWGRVLARVETAEVPPRLLDEVLIEAGAGHAAAFDRLPCLAPLLAAEARARAARRGIWAGAGTAALSPTDITALNARMGEHIISDGRIVSARAVRDRVYLNFTRYWRGGLSMIITERDWLALGRGAAPEDLVGRQVRVRGWLEWRGGPAIMANAAEPIESLDGRPIGTVEK